MYDFKEITKIIGWQDSAKLLKDPQNLAVQLRNR